MVPGAAVHLEASRPGAARRRPAWDRGAGVAEGGPVGDPREKCHKTMTSHKNPWDFLGTREAHEPPKWDSKCGLLSICIRMTGGKHGERPGKF